MPITYARLGLLGLKRRLRARLLKAQPTQGPTSSPTSQPSSSSFWASAPLCTLCNTAMVSWALHGPPIETSMIDLFSFFLHRNLLFVLLSIFNRVKFCRFSIASPASQIRLINTGLSTSPTWRCRRGEKKIHEIRLCSFCTSLQKSIFRTLSLATFLAISQPRNLSHTSDHSRVHIHNGCRRWYLPGAWRTQGPFAIAVLPWDIGVVQHVHKHFLRLSRILG